MRKLSFPNHYAILISIATACGWAPAAWAATETSILSQSSVGGVSSSVPAAVAPEHRAENPPHTITRAVGEVGEHVVTSREVAVAEAVAQALEAKGSLASSAVVLRGDEKTFPAEVAKVLDLWIVYLESKALSAQPIGNAEVAKGVRKVQEAWGTRAAWSALETSTEELSEEVGRQLVVAEFIRLKSDPQLVPISDDDALSYYNKNRLKFGSLPFADFKENIKTFLSKQQTERRLAEWRDVLRRKYKVRNFIAG